MEKQKEENVKKEKGLRELCGNNISEKAMETLKKIGEMAARDLEEKIYGKR